ncbi:MAG TPA: Slp family lipoprotein [Nitrospiraceae bacterium]|jgi:outer membrane lipoprotein|nr:Slp family lipoprotein [Nitrospiraceae bacterium]
MNTLAHRYPLIAVGGVILAVELSACTAGIPSKFVKQAEPGVTLTTLTKNPGAYQGKTVILGGVIVEQKEEGGYIWLKVKNRPLDADHVPRMPTSRDDPESGHYWIIVTRQGLPKSYKDWARVTVVGRVTGEKSPQATMGEPVLAALYLQGWDSKWGGYGQQDTYESDHSIPVSPQGPKRY